MKAASIQRQLFARLGGAADAQLLAVVIRSQDGQLKRARGTAAYDRNAIEELSRTAHELYDAQAAEPFPTWDTRAFTPGLYGIQYWKDIHTPRQFRSLLTFARLTKASGGGIKDVEFERAVLTCLALVVGRLVDTMASTCRWVPGTEKRGGSFIAAANGGENRMRWITDFVEANPFSGETGSWDNQLGWVLRVIENLSTTHQRQGQVGLASADSATLPDDVADALVTDPPYGSAVPYSDLSDFFYIWIRRVLKDDLPDLFSDPLTPKKKEAVVNLRTPGDDRGIKDETFYRHAMTASFSQARATTKPNGIAVIVFADKRTSEWEAMISAVLESRWVIEGSWPIHTERPGRSRSLGSASLSSSIHLVCRPRESPDGSLPSDEIGDWREVLQELPRRIHEWMPRLAEEGVVGADAIFACLGPALEIFSRYSRVEKASGDAVTLKEYLEQVWAAVAKEALTMIFAGADATGFEEDARLTAMWLWTLNAGNTNGNGENSEEEQAEDAAEDEVEDVAKKPKTTGFILEYDAARKIAQGLGAHFENLSSLVEVSGEQARLLLVAERARYLFGKDEGKIAQPQRKKREAQMDLFKVLREVEETAPSFGETIAVGETVLDRIHQSMILFAAGRGEAMKRLLVEDGVGHDQRFWRLAQALAALYPTGTDERRWVEGVLARKRGLGL